MLNWLRLLFKGKVTPKEPTPSLNPKLNPKYREFMGEVPDWAINQPWAAHETPEEANKRLGRKISLTPWLWDEK